MTTGKSNAILLAQNAQECLRWEGQALGYGLRTAPDVDIAKGELDGTIGFFPANRTQPETSASSKYTFFLCIVKRCLQESSRPKGYPPCQHSTPHPMSIQTQTYHSHPPLNQPLLLSTPPHILALHTAWPNTRSTLHGHLLMTQQPKRLGEFFLTSRLTIL